MNRFCYIPSVSQDRGSPDRVPSDEAIVRRVRTGETELFGLVMTRNNERLFRVVVAVLRDAAEAEEVVQEAYVRAYLHLDQFAGRAKFSTWLTRIAIREAWARARQIRKSRVVLLAEPRAEGDPERDAHSSEVHALLEAAISTLPSTLRVVYVLREVQQMSMEETGAVLGLTQANVRVRLHRAKGLIRKRLLARVGAVSPDAFRFGDEKCARLTAAVLRRLPFVLSCRQEAPPSPTASRKSPETRETS
jgi:RNA polymerase sigma-70 factor (ECF subfamily)